MKKKNLTLHQSVFLSSSIFVFTDLNWVASHSCNILADPIIQKPILFTELSFILTLLSHLSDGERFESISHVVRVSHLLTYTAHTHKVRSKVRWPFEFIITMEAIIANKQLLSSITHTVYSLNWLYQLKVCDVSMCMGFE